MSAAQHSGVAVPEWKAESLRFTGFTPAAWGESVDELWAAVVGAPPEQINQRPKEGMVNAEGSFEGARLVLAREPKRTDWVWIVEASVAAPVKEFPGIGEFETVSKTFQTLVKTWLKRDVPLNRIAWGGVLVLPVANREDGYRTLSTFLPSLKIDPVGSSDLNYQINRPRTSKVVDALRVNRLCKWSVALRQSVSIGLSISPGTAEAVGGPTGPGLSACRLEFDINSDAARKEAFASGQVVPLFDEVAGWSSELATRGDVP